MCLLKAPVRTALFAQAALLVNFALPIKSTGQTLAEALDTPGRAWASAGELTTAILPAQAHDGSDGVRLSLSASIRTEVQTLSIIDCYYRSEGLDNYTTFSFGSQQLTAALWKSARLLSGPGSFEMVNKGALGRGALYLDEVNIRPTLPASLAEALDLDGNSLRFSPGTNLIPFAEAEFAPDGQDGALLRGPVVAIAC